MFGNINNQPLPERLAAIANQANRAGDYAAAAKVFDAAYELGGKVNRLISAANMKLKCGCTNEAQAIYEKLLTFDAVAPEDQKLTEAVRKLVIRKLEEAKVAAIATELFPGWQPSQGALHVETGQSTAAPAVASTPARNDSSGSVNDVHSIAGSVVGSPNSSFELAFQAPQELKERVSGPMKAVVDECMVLAAQANNEGSFATARIIYLACNAIMPAKIEVSFIHRLDSC
eukprot:scaffold132257_cov30-Tisochrysis_lutea.AAC.1